MALKLWLVSRRGVDYDQYDAFIVAAETEEDAKATHPSGNAAEWNWFTWPAYAALQVRLIGEAAPGIEAGVVLASFCAG